MAQVSKLRSALESVDHKRRKVAKLCMGIKFIKLKEKLNPILEEKNK